MTATRQYTTRASILAYLFLTATLAACGGSGSGSNGDSGLADADACASTDCAAPAPDSDLQPVTGSKITGVNTNFESGQTHPLRQSPSGERLFAVNTAANSVSVFSLSDPSQPALIAEIPVGLEPVSVWPVSDDEAWVVNHVSDSVSVVSVSLGIVVDTLAAGDEPSDVVVAGVPAHAYVSASRSNEVLVFDLESHALTKSIALEGEHPRAMAVSPNGEAVYVAFALSGNHTTIVPRTASVMPPLEPQVPGLPTAPRSSLIVDASDPEWFPSVLDYTVLDHDVAEIDTAEQRLVGYFDGIGTVNLGLVVHPNNNDIFVSNTEALNLTFFLPNVRGHLVDNRITRVSKTNTPLVTPFDLNPGLDYSQLPNTQALSTALAQPTDIVFEPQGEYLWVASFGTDRIAKVSTSGEVISRIEVGGTPNAQVDSRNKRGPRGLALNAAADRLYVQNRISNTLTTIDTETLRVMGEVPVGADATPLAVKQGRGFLYDAKLSGNGTVSCASCHVDGATDNLAWNLGDLQGSMVPVTDPISGVIFEMHPMKGPMVTQTLQGLMGHAPYHWRGDMPDLSAFNINFDKLMGGAEISDADMETFSLFMDSITLHSNPNLELDRSLPVEVLGGDPVMGRAKFHEPGFLGFDEACSECHSLPHEPFKLQIIAPSGDVRAAKVPLLSQVYKKQSFDNTVGAVNTLGFGEVQDGSVANMGGNGVIGFLVSWDTGTAPAVGASKTINSSNAMSSTVSDFWNTLENRAAVGDNGILVHGQIGGEVRRLIYWPEGDVYLSCEDNSSSFDQMDLLDQAAGDSTFSVVGTHPDSRACAAVVEIEPNGWDSTQGFDVSATCDGEDLSPGLSLLSTSDAVESWAIILSDPDAPTRDPFVHWLIYNIGSDIELIPSSLANGATISDSVLAGGAQQGINEFSTGDSQGYRGPCPPAGESHEYEFTLYGLDSKLDLPPGLNKTELLESILDHVVTINTLSASYGY
jgi:Raf kinase inhibitor-like YbhB/YbcL family protein